MRRRVISDDKENASGSKDNSGKLKMVKRKVKHLFGKADKEEENQAADFEEDDTQVSCYQKVSMLPSCQNDLTVADVLPQASILLVYQYSNSASHLGLWCVQ